jgi:TonB-dependent starch-binding outer membrane protein SusC
MNYFKDHFWNSCQKTILKKGIIVLKISILIILTTTLNLFASETPQQKDYLALNANPPSISTDLQQGLQKKITGTVTDNKSQPIPGVTVSVKGTNQGALTDLNGKYELNVSDKASMVVFSFVGMKQQEVVIGGQTVINVVLQEETVGLNEVVVIGYGTQKKADLTGAVSVVETDKIQGINQTISHALQGQLSGVTVINNAGDPGSGVEIRIRGSGSINDNSPLYVVDGIIVGDISSISPSDIENISVLKDAASAAIYGSRGANGVVIVTTKKGTRGERTSVSFNTSQGIQQVWKMPSSLDAAQMNTIHKEALTNDGIPQTASIWDYYLDPSNAVTRTNWFKEIFRPGYISTNDLSIQGGTKTSNYMFSTGVLDDKGIVNGSAFQRYNIRFNSQTDIVKNLTFGENLSLVYSDQKIIEDKGDFDGILSATLFSFRTTPVWADKANGIYGTPSGDFPNPVASINSRNNHQKQLGFQGNAYLEYKLFNIFTLKTDLGYTMSFGKDKNFVAMAQGGGRGLFQNSLSENYATANTWIWNNTINFDKRFDNHHISGVAGMSMESGYSDATYAGTAKDFSNQDPALRYYSNAGSFPDHATGTADNYALMSYFGRVSYEFADRYLFAANIRTDGSSKFPSGNRWGIFPSVSGGWRISKEQFFSGLLDVVSELKLRASWGQLGNDKIPNYQYYSTISSVESPTLNGAAYTALAQNTIPNMNIKWEVTTQTNVGIDLGLLKDRFFLTADYFDKETSNILVQVPLVSSLGVGTAPFKNSGQVSNKGFDFGLSYRKKDKDFKYEVSLNLSHVANKLVTLGIEGDKEIFCSNYKNVQVGRIAVGEPIGHFWVLHALGIFQSQSEIDNYKNSSGDKIQPSAVPGDVKFEDRNHDGIISNDDRFDAGNSFPTLTYSLNLSAEYKGFDVNMLWIGSHGNSIFDGLTLGGTIMQGVTYNNSTAILDRWTPTNPSNSVPRATILDPNGNTQYSTLYIQNGSYARMKYLTVGYTLNPKVLGPSISKLRLYVTFQNLITLTKYTGFDPEVGADPGGLNNNMYGVDRGTYPQAKSYIFGLNVTF